MLWLLSTRHWQILIDLLPRMLAHGQPFSAPSFSVPQPTFAIINVNKIVGGSSAHITSISPFIPSSKPSPERKDEEEKETLYHTKGEQEDMTVILTTLYLITLITPEAQVIELTAQPITEASRSSQITPRVAKGKGIAAKDDPSPPKLVKDSREVRIDLDGQIKGTKDILKHQDAHLKVLTRARSEKLKQKAKLRKKRFDQNKYERLKKIPSELKLNLALPFLEQDPSLPNHERKTMELEPKTYIVGLHYNRKLPKGIPFVKNLVIEEHEHGHFFIDAFGEPAFQRINDTHKVESETLLGYKVMASNIKTITNQRFNVFMSKMIDERPDKEKIMTKRVNLENLGYTDV
ncbi:hypothetical protein Tco_0800089 [Tanacetum coccineum]|uniref:Uncharacterized protein n=1 Tax=Tanacetum coccineum TaxID=301880 RepID=A0ABQ4ZUU2_9ASTR